MFNSPVKYDSQVINCNLEECINVGPNKIYQPGFFCKCHHVLDTMHIYADSNTLIKVLKNEDHQAQSVCVQGESGVLTTEISEIIPECSQFTQTLRYFQIFYKGSNYEFIFSLLTSQANFKNLKLIEISYLFKEIELLIELLEEDKLVKKSFPNLERLILVNQRANSQMKIHDPHSFDTTSLDVDLYYEYNSPTYNLFKITMNGDYELEIQGKRYKITNNRTHFKIFGTKLLPNSGDYIELIVDTLLEFKIGSRFSRVKTSDTISEEVISARIPFKNVTEISCIVYRENFKDDGENYSFVLDEVRRQNPKAKCSLIIEKKLVYIHLEN